MNDKDEKTKKEKAKKAMSKAEKVKEYLKRADIVEASNILTDLINWNIRSWIFNTGEVVFF